jgi:hypothetical protein
VYEDENGYVLVDYLFNIQKVALHLHLKDGAWSVEKYKRYKTIFEKILDGLREKCYTEVYAYPYETNRKAQKLIAMFGFSEYGRKQGHVLMKRKV